MRCLKLILLLTLLAGCRTFEIGIEPAVTPTSRATGLAAQTTETPAPTITVTSTPIVLSTSTATNTPSATRQSSVRPASTSTIQVPTPTATPETPIILSFSVEPLEVDPGDIVTLHWSVTKADSVDIYQVVPDTLPAYDTVNLPATGAITQTILERERLWHIYELSVPHGLGRITRTVSVAIRCPYTYFFSPLPVDDQKDWSCPDGAPIASAAAEQTFENGRMIWLEQGDMIYVLWNDGTYRTYADTWVAGQLDADPSLTPPAKRYVPTRGFGKVWNSDPAMRSSLGWALAPEQGFATQLQGGWIRCCSQLGAVDRPIYLRNIEGRIIRLWPGAMPPGQWRFVTP